MVLQDIDSFIGFDTFEENDLCSVRKLSMFTDHFILAAGYHDRWIEEMYILCFESDIHCIYSNITSIVDRQSMHSLREQHV
jgi:hypothetical protein